VLPRVDSVLILACGTSYYAGCTARYWLESIAGVPVHGGDRQRVPLPHLGAEPERAGGGGLAVRRDRRHAGGAQARQVLGMHRTLAICNVPTSAMVRETAMQFITRAGVEIGVASTKAFTTQLAALYLLANAIAKAQGPAVAGARARRHPPPAPPAGRGAKRAGAGAADHRRARPSPARRTRCSSAAACTTRSRSKARSS
jgi:glutamine---fructose-6-phosphate transaminase (isomerizing)